MGKVYSWIGLYQKNGTWGWVDGTPVNYTSDHLPTNGVANCAVDSIESGWLNNYYCETGTMYNSPNSASYAGGYTCKICPK